MCALIDWQRALERVNWTKLMQILGGNSINWGERKLIRKLYMYQSVKVRLYQGETKNVKTGIEVDGAFFRALSLTAVSS